MIKMKYQEIKIGNITIGKLREDGRILVKFCDKRHYFVKYRGFGMNKELLDKLIERGLIQIKIRYKKTNNKIEEYKVAAKVWQREGILHQNEIEPYDWQYILPKDKMVREGDEI